MTRFVCLALALLLGCGGCAHSASTRPVPIESRPTPPAPDGQPGATAPAHPPAGPTPQALRARIEADTLAAGSAIRRCTGRQLLAEQESTVESATRLLEDTRAALATGDLARAESLARQARQLTRSLDCP